jgi:1-aminocyclopropane-1-carboxylate deaminase/D-cysteine desulfhydrase-like pyridoxal-dependent ACC family enzyme
MVVAEVLTGIALVQKSVEFIKSNIQTANDIRDIAGSIDDLFAGEKQVQQARNKKAGGSGLGDQFGVDTVAKEIIDAKIAAEQMQEVATMVDMRFGHGTWAGIIAERAKRIQEAKEAAIAAKRQKAKEEREFMETVKSVTTVFAVILVMGGLFLIMMWQITKG